MIKRRKKMKRALKMGGFGIGVVILVLAMTAAVAHAEDFGSIAGGEDYSGSGGGVQESAGPVNFQSAGQAMEGSDNSQDAVNNQETRLVIQAAPEASATIEPVNVYYDPATNPAGTVFFANNFQLYCSSDSISQDSNPGIWGTKIAVKDSQGQIGYVDNNQAWLRSGKDFVQAPGLGMSDLIPGVKEYIGAATFDKYAVRADKLFDTGFATHDQGWDSPGFMAKSDVFFDSYKGANGNLLGAKESDVYVFSSARVTTGEGKVVNVPNVITTFDKLSQYEDRGSQDYGFYNNWYGAGGRDCYYANRDAMLTQVTLSDGTNAMVKLGQLSSTAATDKIAVTDTGKNTWYVKSNDLDKSEDSAFLYRLFTR
jgi:hypothetical protein